MINLIAACSDNFVIGKNNQLIWKISEDLKRFKKLTLNYPIIMGRKTFESLPHLLSNRLHIVITRNNNKILDKKNIIIVNSLEEAIQRGKIINQEIYIIGGGEIYSQSINLIDKMHITRVHTKLKGDTFFPIFDPKDWNLIFSRFFKKNSLNKYNFTFLTYKRKNKII